MIRNEYILFAICVGLFLSGCAPTASHKTLSVNDMSVQTLLSTVSERQKTFLSMEAVGSVAVETPNFSNSGSIELHVKKPDSIFVKIEGPFGIDVADMLLTRENFLIYNSLQNKIIRGNTSKRAIVSLLHMDIDFVDILNIFGGVVSLDHEAALPSEFKIDDDKYLLLYEASGETSRYWIDPITFSVTRIEVQDSVGEPVRQVEFSDFHSQNTTWFPYKMKVSDYRRRNSITLVYSDARVNLQNVTFPFEFPENAEQIDWQ